MIRFILVGICTWYAASRGAVLYTDTPFLPARYHDDQLPFASFPVGWYEDGVIHPGDRMLLYFPEWHEYLLVRALDAGPFEDYYIATSPGLAILADVPQYWAPHPPGRLSTVVLIENLDAAKISPNATLVRHRKWIDSSAAYCQSGHGKTICLSRN